MFLSLLHVNVGNDPDRPAPGRSWLRDIYGVHQRLWMAFPDARRSEKDPFFLATWEGPGVSEPKPKRSDAGFLFRIERDGQPRILIQSAQWPDWEYAFQNAPYLLTSCDRLQFDPAPRLDQAYRFRLLANVVTRKTAERADGQMRTTRAGKTIHRRRRTDSIVRPDALPDPLPTAPAERQRVLRSRWNPWREWLKRAAGRHGFAALETSESPLLMETVHCRVRNPGKGSGGSNRPMDQRFNGGLFEGVLVCTDAAKLRDAVVNGIGNGKAFGFGLLSVAPVQ